MASDIVEDYDKGLELAEPDAILDMQQFGTTREFLIIWKDGKVMIELLRVLLAVNASVQST